MGGVDEKKESGLASTQTAEQGAHPTCEPGTHKFACYRCGVFPPPSICGIHQVHAEAAPTDNFAESKLARVRKWADRYKYSVIGKNGMGELHAILDDATETAPKDSAVAALDALIREQAEDAGLWSVPWEGLQPIAEAHLQQELRKLHAAAEAVINAAQAPAAEKKTN